MTRDRDALAIICTALAGAIALVAAVIMSTRSAPAADDAQSFWREVQPAPKKARRIIYVTTRLHRAVVRHVADRGRTDAREKNGSQNVSRASVPDPRSLLGGARPFAGAVVVRHSQFTPSGDDVDSFARRAVLPDPPRDIYVPPSLMQRDQPLQIFTPPRDRREPSNNRRRELCIAAAIVVAVLGGVVSHLTVSQRGTAHA